MIQIKVISRVHSSLITVGEYAADFHFQFESSIVKYQSSQDSKNAQEI